MKIKKILSILSFILVVIMLTSCFVSCDDGENAEWIYDETTHWHNTIVEGKIVITDKADHTFGENGQKVKTCTICGYKLEEKNPETINPPHTHSFTQEIVENKFLKTAATCLNAAVYYKSCSCGVASTTDTFTSGEALGHNYSNNVCSRCGEASNGMKAIVGSGENAKAYDNLTSAINAAQENDVIKLLDNIILDVKITDNAKLTLDLNGKTLTNVNGDTITIDLGSELTIQDSVGTGIVDNITHAKATIYNNGTVILNGGKYTRSLENGKSISESGGNSYYAILNHGVMTINEGTKVEFIGAFSSLVSNGYYNYSATTKGDRIAYINNIGQANPSLIINGGTFTGGINTIKNDDGAMLVINDGTFENVTQSAVVNCNKATINGGTFTLNNTDDVKYVVFNRDYNEGQNICILNINNGTFSHKIKAGLKLTVSDDVDTSKIDAIASNGNNYYSSLTNAIADAASVENSNDAETIKLLSDLTITDRFIIEKHLVIDLNNHKITMAANHANGQVFRVIGSGVTVTIKNGSIDGTAFIQQEGQSNWDDKECDPIIAREGAIVKLYDLDITINSITGSCAYAFANSYIYIYSGTYTNTTTVDYPHSSDANIKALVLNQANVETQLIFVEGGTYKGYSPANGDESKKVTSFLASSDYEAKTNENGSYTVQQKNS